MLSLTCIHMRDNCYYPNYIHVVPPAPKNVRVAAVCLLAGTQFH